jgi:hypothetical protein
MNNKQGARWTDLHTVTHFRNALRGVVLKCYNALPIKDADYLVWENLKT